MVGLFSFTSPRGVLEPTIVATVLPNDAGVTYSDLAGSWTVDAAKAEPVRPIVDGQGYEYAAPGAKASISVTASAPTSIVINVVYTGLITRDDPYNDMGSVEVRGVVTVNFNCPIPRVTDHPVAAKQVVVPIPAGTSTVRLIWPYCASMKLESWGLPAGVTVGTAPVAPTPELLMFGDSRPHGMFASRTIATFAYLTAEDKGAQLLNLGYGGRPIVPSDATTAGGFAANAAFYLSGFNAFYPNGANIADVQANYYGVITNYRAAVTAAGRPTCKLVMCSDLWSTSDAGGGGPYDDNVPTLQQFRDAMQAAVIEAADPYCSFLPGNTGGMPTGTDNFPDGIHPNDQGAAVIAGVVSTALGSI